MKSQQVLPCEISLKFHKKFTWNLHYFQSLFIWNSPNHTWRWNSRHPFAIDAVHIKRNKYHITVFLKIFNNFFKNLTSLGTISWFFFQNILSDVFFKPINFRFFFNQIIIMRFGSCCSFYSKLNKPWIVFLKDLIFQHLPKRRPRMSFTIF